MTDSSDERNPVQGERTAPARNRWAAHDELRAAVADGELRRLEREIIEQIDGQPRARPREPGAGSAEHSGSCAARISPLARAAPACGSGRRGSSDCLGLAARYDSGGTLLFASFEDFVRLHMEYSEPTPEEREKLLAEWRRAYSAFQAALSDLSDDDLDKLAEEITEEVDEAIRQEAIRLRRRAS